MEALVCACFLNLAEFETDSRQKLVYKVQFFFFFNKPSTYPPFLSLQKQKPPNMKSTALFSVALTILGFASSLVDAHTYLSSVQIDNMQYTQGQCIRPLAGGFANSPIQDVNSEVYIY